MATSELIVDKEGPTWLTFQRCPKFMSHSHTDTDTLAYICGMALATLGFHQLLAVGRWFPPGTPVSSTRELISSSSFHRLDMTLAVAEALTPNTPNQMPLDRAMLWTHIDVCIGVCIVR